MWKLLISIVPMAFVGCQTPPKGPTAASSSSWSSTRKLSEEEKLSISVSVLGKTNCSEVTKSIIKRKLQEAKDTPLRDRVLCLSQVAVNATHYGALREAKLAFDDALDIMGSVITDEKALDKMLSLSGSESEKIFKGHPVERAMCFLYRGLIYLAEGDCENARACFLTAAIQDERVEDGETIASNWISLEYLQAVADNRCGGSMNLDFPRDIPDDLAVGNFNRNDDSLFVVASGFPPLKVHEEIKPKEYGLSWKPVVSEVSAVRLYEDVGKVSSSSDPNYQPPPIINLEFPSEDIYIQAVSRGRRDMDKVLEAKQQMAGAAESHAKTAEVVGVTLNQLFGIYALPVTLTSMAIATSERDKAAKAEAMADLRQITSLPGKLYIGTFKSSSLPVVIKAIGKNGKVICSKRFTSLPLDKNGFNVLLVRIYR